MSKKLDLPDSTPEVKLEEPKAKVFPYTALSIIHVGNSYQLVEIGFNMETGDTSSIKELCSRHTREEVIEQFKLAVIKNGIFG